MNPEEIKRLSNEIQLKWKWDQIKNPISLCFKYYADQNNKATPAEKKNNSFIVLLILQKWESKKKSPKTWKEELTKKY